MANANIASGLKPINEIGGGWSGQGMLIAFSTGEANNIFLGDPVVPVGTTDANGVPYMTLATAGGGATVAGAFLGITNGPSLGGNASTPLLQSSALYRLASTLTYGLITPDPQQVFAIQEDSVGGSLLVSNAGWVNADLVSGTGNTSTALSGWMLDSSTAATTSTLQLRVLGLLRAPDNAMGTNAKWAVRLNTPALWAATGY